MTRTFAFIELLRLSARDEQLGRVLGSLADAIVAAEKRVAQVQQTGDEVYLNAVIDDESDFAEALIGASYVVCQAAITAVVSRALHLRRHLKDDLGLTPQHIPSGKKKLLEMGEQAGSSGYSKVQVLDAFANYFKHRDEWADSSWVNLDDRSMRTVQIIRVAGATPHSTGNLRTGAAFLGNQELWRSSVFEDAINSWADFVITAAEKDTP